MSNPLGYTAIMSVNHQSIVPMAEPFRIDTFRFRRQAQLERELDANAALQTVGGQPAPEWRADMARSALKKGVFLPPGVIPLLDTAVLRMRTVGRVPYPVRMSLRPNSANECQGCALLDDGRLDLAVPTGLLRRQTSEAALTYHLASEAFTAMQHYPRYLSVLISSHVPLLLEDRMKAYEILRLNTYAAECFALVCCGDLEVALREGLFVCSGLECTKDVQVNLDAWARHVVANTAFPGGNVFEHYRPLGYYEPIRPLVLRRFVECQTYRACLGLPGGISREQFEEEVLELDRQAFPLSEIPEEHCAVLNCASLVAAYGVMAASGTVTPARLELLADSFDLDSTDFPGIATSLRWNWDGDPNTWEILESLTPRPWKALHGAHIMQRAFSVAIGEYHGRPPESTRRALADLAANFGFTSDMYHALFAAALEESKKPLDQNE
jgi:hypothetical protein